jgi:hypothetical protein
MIRYYIKKEAHCACSSRCWGKEVEVLNYHKYDHEYKVKVLGVDCAGPCYFRERDIIISDDKELI